MRLAGVVWGLYLTLTTLSVPALMGAIMSLGVATANSVLVVTFARNNLQQGHDPLTAAWEAGVGRLRPVLMTALAMIIGMLPMSLALGEGGEQNAPARHRSDRRPGSCHCGHTVFRARGVQPATPQHIGRSLDSMNSVQSKPITEKVLPCIQRKMSQWSWCKPQNRKR